MAYLHSIAAKMARTFIVVTAFAVVVAFCLTAVNVSAASQDIILHRRKSAPQEKSNVKCECPKTECPKYECPRCKCPTTTLYRMVNDALNKHPWLNAPLHGLCWIIKAHTGVFGATAIEYIVHPALVSMRANERYHMLTSSVFETVIHLAGSSMMLGSSWWNLTAIVVGWVNNKRVSHGNSREAYTQTHDAVSIDDRVHVHESNNCNAVVEKTGKPCIKPGATQRDGRWVCGVHARSRRVAYR